MMWGCWPRYWVISMRPPSSASLRSASESPVGHRAHDQLGPVQVVDRAPGPGRALGQLCSMACALYCGDTR